METKIYLKLKNKPRSVNTLIKSLYNIKYDNNTYKSNTTYSDDACTIVQCSRKRNRSFEEIYILCKTYFPKIKEKDVVEALLSHKVKNKHGIHRCTIIYCPTILKPVVYYSSYYTRYMIPKTKGMAAKSWRQLLRKVGISSAVKLYEYFEHQKELENGN